MMLEKLLATREVLKPPALTDSYTFWIFRLLEGTEDRDEKKQRTTKVRQLREIRKCQGQGIDHAHKRTFWYRRRKLFVLSVMDRTQALERRAYLLSTHACL